MNALASVPASRRNLAVTYPFPRVQRDRTVLLYRGRIHTVIRETLNGEAIVLNDEESGRPETLSAPEFWEAYDKDQLVIEDEELDKLPSRFVAAIERAIDPSVEKDGWDSYRRFKYCVRFDDEVPSKSAKGMDPMIAAVSAEIRDPAPPNWKTVSSWIAKRGTPSKRLARYMRTRNDQKGRTDWLDPEVDLVVEQAIEEYYKTRQQLSPKEIAEEVHGEIAIRNRGLRATMSMDDVSYNMLTKEERRHLGFLIEPHATTVLRRIARHEGYETTKARKGKKAADDAYKPVRRSPPVAKRINHVWYIDHTRLDGHLVLKGPRAHVVLGRPWVTIVVDAFSRLIVGVFISFIPPSLHSVSAALKNAIKSKVYVGEKYPGIDGVWQAMGLPSKVVCDRALEFVNGSFERSCAELGIEVIWCPRKRPQWKGIIERSIQTFNTDFVDLMPGATKGARKRKAEEEWDPTAAARIDYDDLEEQLYRWLILVHARKVHGGIGRRPGDVYAEGVLLQRPTAPRRASDLDVLGFSYTRTLTRKGIQFMRLRYSDARHVFEMLDRAGREKAKVTIFVDPADLSAIVVRDPTDGRRVRLACIDSELADVTLWERRNVLAWMREMNEDLADREKMLVAKKAIRDAWAKKSRAKVNIAQRNAAARGLGIGGEGARPPDVTVLKRVLDVEADTWTLGDYNEIDEDDTEEAGEVPSPALSQEAKNAGRPGSAPRKAVAARKAKVQSTRPGRTAVDAAPVDDRQPDVFRQPRASIPPSPDGLTSAERLSARLAAGRTPLLTRA